MIFIVEGPRDALSMLQIGIPACAIIGAKIWSKLKEEIIASAEPNRVALLFDNDKAGRKGAQYLIKISGSNLPLKNILLPRKEKIKRKIDPADLSVKNKRKIYKFALDL